MISQRREHRIGGQALAKESCCLWKAGLGSGPLSFRADFV